MAVSSPEEYLAYRKSSSFSRFKELPTLLTVIGDVKDQDILDVGCGIGYYSRMLAESGAKSVLGIDKSEEVLKTAQQCVQGENPLPNLNFQVMDAVDVGFEKKFDMVLTNYTLCHAQSKDQLKLMCRKIFDALKPGGRAVGIMQIAEQGTDFTKALGTGRYGVILNVPKDVKEGDPYSISIFGSHCEPKHVATYYWYNKETYKQCLLDTGFQLFDCRDFKVSSEGLDAYGPDYWKPIMANPIYGVFEAKKTN